MMTEKHEWFMDELNGCFVCIKCGLTKGQVYSDKSSRIYDEFDEVKKQHEPVYGKVRTFIGNYKDPLGKNAYLIKRLRRINKNNNYKNSLRIAKNFLKKLKEFNTENITQDTFNLFKACQEKKILRGRSIEDALLTCNYVSTSKSNQPVSLKKMINTYKKYGLIIHPKIINKILKEMKEYELINNVVINVNDLIESYFMEFSDLKYAQLKPLINHATNLNNLLKIDKNLAGKSPSGLMGAILYTELNTIIKVTQDDVCDYLEITPVTIRNNVERINEKLLQARKQCKEKVKRKSLRDKYLNFIDESLRLYKVNRRLIY